MFPEKIVKEKDNLFSGEREIGTKLEEISNDHINRYNFAKYFVREEDIVLDAACGVGYGSFMLAEKAARVHGIDYSREAIRYALDHWSRKNITYIEGDLLDGMAYPVGERYNVIVSFETMEHLRDDRAFLTVLSQRLCEDGILVISTPNANNLKSKDNPWHQRHYTPSEFRDLLSKYFRYISNFTQIKCGIRKGVGGDNNIIICSNWAFLKVKVMVYEVHTFLYRLKRRVFKLFVDQGTT
jgi:2-polyprenyl-3-methyl-5-hydroxy-6-metoxy-1,4-benzoquinol methylase